MLSDKPQPRFAIQSFFWSAGDRLAAEHELLSKVVSEFATRDWQFETIDLQATEAGRQILSKDALALTRTIAALVEQTSYWDKLGAKSRVLAQTEMERINWHHHPEWEHIWPRRMVCFGILRQLMRRKLPFGREHLIQFADWIADADWI